MTSDAVLMAHTHPVVVGGGGNLRSHHPPCEYLGKYTSRGKPKIPPADRILIDPGHKARKIPSNNADLGFQAVGPALRIMQLNFFSHTRNRRHTNHPTPLCVNINKVKDLPIELQAS